MAMWTECSHRMCRDWRSANGGALIEFVFAMSLLAVLIASLGAYSNAYLSYSEENQVTQALKLGRLSAIPAVVVRDGTGKIVAASDFTGIMQLYLQASFVSRDAIANGGGCASSGDYRSFIISFKEGTDPDSCTAETEESSRGCELLGGGIVDCNGQIVGDLTEIPDQILAEARRFVEGSRENDDVLGQARVLVGIFSNLFAKLGGIFVDAEEIDALQAEPKKR